MKPTVIVDTNVLVGGFLTLAPDSPLKAILDRMLSSAMPFLLSPRLLEEYRTVLLRPKIASRHRLTEAEVDAVLETIVANAIWRDPNHAMPVAPDPGDNHLWSLISLAPRSILITGDQLLLQNPPSQASVLSPRSYLELIVKMEVTIQHSQFTAC